MVDKLQTLLLQSPWSQTYHLRPNAICSIHTSQCDSCRTGSWITRCLCLGNDFTENCCACMCVFVVQGHRSCYGKGISLQFLKWFFSAVWHNELSESLITHHRRSPLMSGSSDIVSIGRLGELFWIILSWLEISFTWFSCCFEGPLGYKHTSEEHSRQASLFIKC